MGNCQYRPRHAGRPRRRSSINKKRVSDSSSHGTMPSTALTEDMMESSSLRSLTPLDKPQRRDAIHGISAPSSSRLSFADNRGLRFQCTSLEVAKQESVSSGSKPIFCIEVDVPGQLCSGKEVLSHPLIAEAAETLFVSVECRLEKDEAPVNDAAGNRCYTKVRLLDTEGVDLVTPIWGELLCVAKVASAMVQALQATNQHVPPYLQLLETEESGRTREGPSGSLRKTARQAIFGMPCSKTGEVEFAGLDGVLETRAGYYEHNPVVCVTYDTSRLPYSRLVRYALQHNLAQTIFFQSCEERVVSILEMKQLNKTANLVKYVGELHQPSHVDPKHALRQTILRFVPMTDLQACKANRLCNMGAFHEAMHLLSPRQGKILMKSIQNPQRRRDVTDVPITTAWQSVVAMTA